MQVPGMIYMAVVAFMGALAAPSRYTRRECRLCCLPPAVCSSSSATIFSAHTASAASAASARTSAFTRPITPRSCSSRGAYSLCEYLRWERTELITKSLTRARPGSSRGRISLQTGTPRNLTEPLTNFWRRSDRLRIAEPGVAYIAAPGPVLPFTPLASRPFSAACASCRRA